MHFTGGCLRMTAITFIYRSKKKGNDFAMGASGDCGQGTYWELKFTPYVAGDYEVMVRPDFHPEKEVKKPFEVKEEMVKTYVTAKQLSDMGFRDHSKQSEKDLNKTLELFGIISKKQIQLFLAVCLFEGGTDKDHVENDSKNYKNSGYSYFDYRSFNKDKNKKVIIGSYDPKVQKWWGYDKNTKIYKYVRPVIYSCQV